MSEKERFVDDMLAIFDNFDHKAADRLAHDRSVQHGAAALKAHGYDGDAEAMAEKLLADRF